MLEYKTRVLPDVPLKGVKKDEYRFGISVETGNRAVAPIGQAIEEEAQEGWIMHDLQPIPQTIIRKRSIFEWIFGWIPFLGKFLCPNLDETRNGKVLDLWVVTFVREI